VEDILREWHVEDVAATGLVTQHSVEHSVRHAADFGYRVTMIVDCCASANMTLAKTSFVATAMLADIIESDA
jgi:nicotinamidase-related amidase